MATREQRNNRYALQIQLDNDLSDLILGEEWELKPVDEMPIDKLLAAKNTLERIIIYLQAGWL